MVYVDRPDSSRRFGFTAYADGTPRFEPADAAVIDEPRWAPEDIASDWEDEPPELADPPSTKPHLPAILAAAAAVAVAAFIGTVLIRSPHHESPAHRSTPSPTVAPAPERPVRNVQATPAGGADTSPNARQPIVSSPPLTAPHRGAAPAKARRGRLKAISVGMPTQLNCARPASPGQRMVCHSPGLRAADRRMMRAYAEAKAAGAPPRALRQDQVTWLKARDAAARRSRRAVEELYRSRIQVLESRPYPACVGSDGGRRSAAGRPSGRWGVASVTHWILSVPRKIASPKTRSGCG
ncbi:MAG TPA: lysozyme inhibitor LprI family protein [Phenylobacterium sp.]|jgi:uncharacterized protein YecT (DUF1311 family)|uniref:lysozyme inhibitor LprI family protein n=1 Tax=Phenylobacterium sp. TaxID=1871053 RepID=UPI002D27E3D5|nr:lysozyme inhibitor LprI family protein [Phenylobacterium sp.]HZZ68615.1 lysozyme inhibitor LprI family protein [Phenylobacterium sp.]